MERTKSFKYRQLTSCKCFKMRKASRLTTQFYDKKLKSVGIRITQFTILSFIATTENKTLISLSEELSMDRTTRTRGLNILLKDGLIQQLDTPKQIYNKPANLFVAGFIGSPSMNFLKANFDKSSQKLIVGKKQIDISKYENINNLMNDQKVIFGIRPENINIEKN